MTKNLSLRVSEIFFSLQGETTRVGLPTTFIRLTGCPLRCQYCDTAYAFNGGTILRIDEILQRIAANPTHIITVTGGEPLAQKNCFTLLDVLCNENFDVSLETSGAIDIKDVDPRVIKILDIKTPGSKEESRNIWENLNHLQAHDQIKFVICNREDYEWAKTKLIEYPVMMQHEVLFSSSYAELTSRQLADWILTDGLKVRLQIQLHKMLWGDAKGR